MHGETGGLPRESDGRQPNAALCSAPKLRSMTSVYIARGAELLLLYRIGSRVVPPCWCGIGGHFEPEEMNDPQACLLRELKEETGIGPESLLNLRMRYMAISRREKEIRLNYYFFADLLPGTQVEMCYEEGKLQWLPFDRQLLEREMPRSAKAVLCHYYETGRHDDKIYAGAATGDTVAFHELTVF